MKNTYRTLSSSLLLNSLVLILFAVAGLLTGCGESKLPNPYMLKGLRVLAIQADRPEVNPVIDGTFSFTPLISDPEGEGRTLTYEVQMCTDLGIAYGADPDCEESPDATAIKSGQFSLTAPIYTEALAPVTPGDFSGVVPATILLGRSEAVVQNGVAYLITLKITAEDGTEVKSFKRILASEKTVLNTNPNVTEITDGKDALSTYPSESVSLQLSAADPESFTRYKNSSQSENVTEKLTVSWYSYGGQFTRSRTVPTDTNDKTKFKPKSTSLSRPPAFLMSVLRDDRGGVSWTTPLVEAR